MKMDLIKQIIIKNQFWFGQMELSTVKFLKTSKKTKKSITFRFPTKYQEKTIYT